MAAEKLLLASGAIALATFACMPSDTSSEAPKPPPEFTLHLEGSCSTKPPTLTPRDYSVLDMHTKVLAGILDSELTPEMLRYIQAPQKVSQLKDLVTFAKGRDYASQIIFHDKVETAYCYPFMDASTKYGVKKNVGPTNDIKFTYRMSDDTRFLLQDPWLRRTYRDKRFKGAVTIDFYRPQGVYDGSGKPLTSGYDILITPKEPLFIPFDQLEGLTDYWFDMSKDRVEQEPEGTGLPVGPNRVFYTREWRLEGTNKRVIWRANQLGQIGKTVRFPKLTVVPGF